MMKTKEQPMMEAYEAPSVEVIEAEVEKGFAVTDGNAEVGGGGFVRP